MELQRDQNQSGRSSYRAKVVRMADMELRQEISDLFDRLLEAVEQRRSCSFWELDYCIQEYMGRFQHRRRASAYSYRNTA